RILVIDPAWVRVRVHHGPDSVGRAAGVVTGSELKCRAGAGDTVRGGEDQVAARTVQDARGAVVSVANTVGEQWTNSRVRTQISWCCGGFGWRQSRSGRGARGVRTRHRGERRG